jgi:hypothetical protein
MELFMKGARLPVGSKFCQCSECGRYFTAVSSFDRHQILAEDGSVICRDPESVVSKKGVRKLFLNTEGYWQGPEMGFVRFTSLLETTKGA